MSHPPTNPAHSSGEGASHPRPHDTPHSGGGITNPRPTEAAATSAHNPQSALENPARRPALWPWVWNREHGAIMHAQGCALCDAYVDHVDIERELGVRSLATTEHDRGVDLTGKARQTGYTDGLVAGRQDAEIVQTYDAADDNARLRALVRTLEQKCEKLQGRLVNFKLAHGIDADEEGAYESFDDDDDDDSGDEKRARPAVSTAKAASSIRRYFGARQVQWNEHREDVQRLRQAARALDSSNVAPPPPSGATHALAPRATAPAAAPAALPPAAAPADCPPSPRSQSVANRQARRNEKRRASPPPSIPTRRGRSHSRVRDYRDDHSRAYDRSPPRHRQRSRSLSRTLTPRQEYSPRRTRSPVPRAYSPSRGPGGSAYPAHGTAPVYPPPVGLAQGGRGTAPSTQYERRAHPKNRQARFEYNPGPAYPATVPAPVLPIPRFTSSNAPPFPNNLDDLREVITLAELDSVIGLQAVAKLRYWLQSLQGRRSQDLSEIERELSAYRTPLWFKERYEPERVAREEKRAMGIILAEPKPEDDPSAWVRYLNMHKDQMKNHVRRDSRGRVYEDTVRGYVWANRMANVDVNTEQRRRVRNALFRFLARAFQSSEHYESELVRTDSVVSPTFNAVPYPGPFPPTLDDAIRHAASCGITPGLAQPPLTAWSDQYSESVPSTRAAAQPVAGTNPEHTEADAPTPPVDGLGASTPGGDQHHHGQAEPSGASSVPDQDVVMQGPAPET